MIEFDVETTGLQWYAADLFMAQFLAKEGEAVALAHPGRRKAIQGCLDAVPPGFFERADGYRAWNSKFDLHFLDAAGYKLPDEHKWHDGMLMAHIIDERPSAALQARGDALFGEAAGAVTERALREWLNEERARRRKEAKADKTEFVRPNYSDVPDDIILPYALHDVELQRAICDIYEPQIEAEPDYARVYELERGTLRALYAAETRGIPFDREALVGLEAALMPTLTAAEDQCIALSEFRNFNPRSPKQLSEALDRLGADVRFMTRSGDTGLLKTDEENLNACDHPLAEAILAYRGQQKVWSYVRRLLHGDADDDKFPAPYLTGGDMVHPNFHQVGARTGRMSCSNPNFQNIPRDDLRTRYAVRARPGKRLVCVDLDGIELRVLAAYAGEGRLLDELRSDGDPHQQVADMLGFQDRVRSTGAIESARSRGKKWNYLKNYGGGIRAICKWFQCDQAQARAYRDRYNEAYPEVKALEERIEIALEDKGYIRTPWGRRHRVKDRRHVDREAYMFMAYLNQGTAADLFKDSLVKVHDQGVPIIACVHDELIAEVDEADAAEAGQLMVKALTEHEELTCKVPLRAEAQIVERWSQAKDPNYVPDYMKEG